jgi:hypothetical protein
MPAGAGILLVRPAANAALLPVMPAGAGILLVRPAAFLI